jgi:hypothetical protein
VLAVHGLCGSPWPRNTSVAWVWLGGACAAMVRVYWGGVVVAWWRWRFYACSCCLLFVHSRWLSMVWCVCCVCACVHVRHPFVTALPSFFSDRAFSTPHELSEASPLACPPVSSQNRAAPCTRPAATCLSRCSRPNPAGQRGHAVRRVPLRRSTAAQPATRRAALLLV